jgi:hypothetical protein
MTVSLVALDGSAVEISIAGDFAPGFSGDIMYRDHAAGGRPQRFASGPRDFARRTAFDSEICVGMTLDEEYMHEGGVLLLGWGNQPVGADGVDYWEFSSQGELRRRPFRIAVWEGGKYSLYGHMYGGESHDLLDTLLRVLIRETELGLICTPKDGKTTPLVDGPSIMQVVRSLGLLYIRQMTNRTAKEVPRFRGTAVDGGELFVEDPESPTQFMLVNDTSITQVFATESENLQSALDQIETLSVEWRAA